MGEAMTISPYPRLLLLLVLLSCLMTTVVSLRGSGSAAPWLSIGDTTCFQSNRTEFPVVSVRWSIFSPDLCGQCLNVTCLGEYCKSNNSSTVVKIVDSCSSATCSILTLSSFDVMADITTGGIYVSYERLVSVQLLTTSVTYKSCQLFYWFF
ncbi:hypothetical protein O6H91_04G081000 [Diphasiastrum complanatum]|uniref:Uncharacterized protein n=1 Tax=Diphasiastrum complanatum TaxID=34168 RepID=A0ACC2DZC1_DIPCM|nr:hypothetical protein O6H91_04G081000 [Diphasiastrum complanatum]